jgi:hypothetical protein
LRLKIKIMPSPDYILDLQISNRKTNTPLAVVNKDVTYGSHYSHWGIGGYIELPSIEYRNAIPSVDSISEDLFSSGRRKVGMIVYVISENKYYQLIPREINEIDITKPGEPVSLKKWLFYRSAKKTILLNPGKQNLDDFDDGTVVDELGEFGPVGGVDSATYDVISGSNDPNHCWTEIFVKGNFNTLADLENYISNNTSAYAGQICSVIQDKKVYLVVNTATVGVLGLQEIGTGGGSGEVFDDDFEVSIAAGKTFGKYANGDLVLAKNKTPKEVILMACLEALSPTLNIFSGDVIEFGESGAKTLEIEFNYTIRTKNATVSSIKIERKKGSSSSWTNISDVTTVLNWSSSVLPPTNPPSSPISDTFNHEKYDTTSLYYRLTVTDSSGGTNSIIYTFNPNTYVAPSLLASPAPNIGSLTRYKGDNDNIIYTATIKKNSLLVPITSYQLQRKIDNATNWESLGAAVPVTTDVAGSNFSIAVSLTDSSAASNATVRNANTLKYRIIVSDEYKESLSVASFTELGEVTISFYHRCGTIYSSKMSLAITDIDNAAVSATNTSPGVILQDSKARNFLYPVKPGVGNYLYYVYKASGYPPRLQVAEGNPALTLLGGSFAGGVNNPSEPQLLNDVTNKHGATVSYVVHRSSSPNSYGNVPGTPGTTLTFS